MPEEQKTIPSGYREDAMGRLVPESAIKEIDLARDDLVKELIEKAQQVAGVVAAFKADALDDIQAFVDLSTERFGKNLGGQRGNVTLTSFDGEYRIRRAIDDRIEFDEGLQAAKALIDACIKDWSAGSNDNIKALVNDAFYVDHKGRLNTRRILGLRRLKITEERWQQAMDAISESIQIVQSKTYIRLYRRNPKSEQYEQIPLDIAK